MLVWGEGGVLCYLAGSPDWMRTGGMFVVELLLVWYLALDLMVLLVATYLPSVGQRFEWLFAMIVRFDQLRTIGVYDSLCKRTKHA